ncbi:hypothetical protein K2173_021731 [Erythroxylum novogranatense]|uniref:Cytochrome P450 n=1 Tax=Erythroxylum novogranatense TaxID=1862640 RepID=A0AAV8TJT9_9ROSI|nr:hypothetical protein K2173_021731 [Erythroxylum novogranatense]
MSPVDFIEGTNLFFPILFFIPLLFFFIKHLKKQSEFKSAPLPPGPYGWPILGNIQEMGKKPHVNLTNLAQKYGPLFSLRLGSQLVVVGSSQIAAAEILKTHDRVLSGRYVPHAVPAKSPELNNLSLGWALECGESWKSIRTLCRRELFSPKALESQALARENTVKKMIEFVNKMEGKEVKIRDVAFAVVFNMLGKILVSKDLITFENESLQGETSKLLREIMEVASTPNISDLFPILSRFDIQGIRRKFMEINTKFSNLLETIIKERRHEQVRDHRDFLDALISNCCNECQIHQLLGEFLIAGSDTSSSTIEWTMAELMKNPDHMKKVEEEIARENGVKESHLPHLTYLQACVNETLRLHPPAPFLLPHRAVNTCEVMGYTIPKNSQVLVNAWAIGRDPGNWEEPHIFKPERFLDSNMDFKGNDFNYIPFGAGRRICPGLPMAAKHVPLKWAIVGEEFNYSWKPE